MKEDNEGHEYSQVQRGSQMEGRSAADDVGRCQGPRGRGRAPARLGGGAGGGMPPPRSPPTSLPPSPLPGIPQNPQSTRGWGGTAATPPRGTPPVPGAAPLGGATPKGATTSIPQKPTPPDASPNLGCWGQPPTPGLPSPQGRHAHGAGAAPGRSELASRHGRARSQLLARMRAPETSPTSCSRVLRGVGYVPEVPSHPQHLQDL